jgi:DNA polymerase
MLSLPDRSLDIVTLDFETAWGKDFTLSKMPTSKYVRDERFKAFMCGIKINAKPVRVWGERDIQYALDDIDWSRAALLAHNTAFDGFICTQRYKVRPAFYLDTLSMARGALGHAVLHNLDTVGKLLGVGGKQGSEILVNTKDRWELTPEELLAMASYCSVDVQRCYEIFHKLYDFIPDTELKLIDTTLRMFCEPVLRVNTDLVREELEEEIGGKMSAMILAGVSREDLMSNAKLVQLLHRAGEIPPMKISPATGKVVADCSADALKKLAERTSNDKVKALVTARLKVKSTIGETRAQAFLDTSLDGSTMPVGLSYYGAHTGRWSGTNKMNMQNLPRGGRLRKSLTAPKGHQVVVADSAQIEARVNAWLWDQLDLLQAFRDKRDLYSEFATDLFGRPVDRKLKLVKPDGTEWYPDFAEGFVGKTAILGLGFQMGAMKFKDTCAKAKTPVYLSDEQAATAVDLYRRKNNMIARGWKLLQDTIPRMTMQGFSQDHKCVTFMHQAVRLPNGMFLRYPGLDCSAGEASFKGRRGARNKLYGGLMDENIVQALARIIVAEQMLQIEQELGVRPVLMTHDEIVGVVPNHKAEKAFEKMIKIMSTPPEWAPTLPLAAEGGFADNYSK